MESKRVLGWASGSRLFSSVIQSLKDAGIEESQRKTIYVAIIPAFWEHDWDTENECEGLDPAFDAAMELLWPGYFEEDS